MGFYGNISGSTKSAFTFDKVYANRTLMDQSLDTGVDTVFLGRYVLVEYDDAPVSIWIVTRDNVSIAYTDYELTTRLVPMANIVYRDENSGQTTHSTVDFYEYDIAQRKLVKVQGNSPYGVNYNIDVQKYGRGYDGTVWRKIYDTTLNKYRYVLLAELNAAVPTFHYTVDNPLEISTAPSIDSSDSTNLNYYIHQRGYIMDRFKTDSNGDVRISQPSEAWTYNNDGTEKTHTYNIGEETVAIKFNRAGFSPANHQVALESNSNDVIMGTNVIAWTPSSSGRHYNVSLANPQGVVANDVRNWSIDLPVLGNVVHKMYDIIYGYNGTSRTITNWQKTNLAQNDKMYRMDTMVGAINRVRDALGYNVITQSSAPTQVKTTDDTNLYLIGPDVQTNGGIDSYYYYAKQPVYVSDTMGDYYYDAGTYRVANKLTVPADQLLKLDHYEYKPIRLTNLGVTMYGLVVTLNRLMGVGVTPGTLRDTETIPGMMGRVSDIFERIDTALLPNRIIATNSRGIIGTVGSLTDEVGLFPYVPAGVTADSANDNGDDYVMSGKGNWRLPANYLLTGLTPNATYNDKIRHAVAVTDTLNQAIGKIAREFADVYGARAASTLSALVKNANTPQTDNYETITGIDTFDKVANIFNNRTESVDERIKDLRMFRYFAIANGEADVANTKTNITAAIGIADSDNNADTFYFKTGNKWIRLALDTTTDKLTIAHVLSADTAGEIAPSATGWGSGTNADNAIVIPKFTIDEAGHVVGHGSNTYYLPHGFKYVSVAAQSSAVDNSTGNTETIKADSSADTLTFATANKWLTIAASDASNADKVTLGHITAWAAHQEIAPTAEAGWTRVSENKITLPTFDFDEAGHLVGHNTKDFYLPHSFKAFSVLAQNTGSTASTGNTNTVTADNSSDTLRFSTDNKWVTIRAVESGEDDTIYFGHAYDGTAGNQSFGLQYSKKVAPTETELTNHDYVNLDSTNQFEIPYFTVDQTGHIISASTQHVIIPENFVSIATANAANVVNPVEGNTDSHSASSLVDALTLKGSNKWIIAAATTDDNKKVINFSHKLNGTLGAQTNIGNNTTVNMAFNGTFVVPYLSIDEAGHVTGLSSKTITLPQNSISGNKTSDNNDSNVLTDLTLTQTSGAFTRTYTNVGSLKLTGFVANTAGSTALAVSDTINGAFAKLEARIAYEESNRSTAINTEVTNRNTAISNAIGTLTVDSNQTANVQNAIAKALATAKEYTDTELGKLNSNYSTSPYLAATRAAIKAVDDKFGTLVVGSGETATVANAIAKAASDASQALSNKIGTLSVGQGQTSTVENAIALVNNKFANYKTATELTTILNDYVKQSALTTTLNSYVTQSGLTTTLADYVQSSVLDDYVATDDVESAINDVIRANYDLSLKAPVIVNFTADATNGLEVEIEPIAGTITYQWMKDDQIFDAGTSNTRAGSLAAGEYKVTIKREYNGLEITTTSDVVTIA